MKKPLFKPYDNFARRRLHLFPEAHNEVAIVNNSGLFFTLASLRKHGRNAHPALRVIMPEFWLDKTHSDYNNLDWGQTPLGLPWFVRNEFYKLFKNHHRNEYIRWGQMKELRKFILSELKEFGVSIDHGIPDITVHGHMYKVRTKETTFSVPVQNSFFYNSFRVANVNHQLDELIDDIYHRPHTEIYQRSLEENSVGSIAILGSNRSTIWIAKHFPALPVACIALQSPEASLFSGEELPQNLVYYPAKLNGTKYTIEPSNVLHGGIFISGVGQSKYTDFSGEFYCAIGLKHMPEITKNIKINQQTLYPTSKMDLNVLGNWINPEEQPVGGLVEATSRWAHMTDNLSWAYECYCFHEETTIDYIANQFEQKGIILSNDFFDALKDAILKEHYVPSLEGLVEIYQQAYLTVCPSTPPKKLNEIKLLLTRINDERTESTHSTSLNRTQQS